MIKYKATRSEAKLGLLVIPQVPLFKLTQLGKICKVWNIQAAILICKNISSTVSNFWFCFKLQSRSANKMQQKLINK